MRSLHILILIFICSYANSQVLRDDTPLGEVVLFGELHMLLPVSVLVDSLDEEKQMFIEAFEDLGKRKMSDESGELLISVNQREAGVSRKTIINLTEKFAQNLYRGTIYRKDDMQINGLDIYVLDIIGYWNGSKTPSSMLFLVVFTETAVYDFLIRYPEEDFDYSDAIKEEIIYSIRIKK